ncbi:serine/threonine-protein kinase ppk6 [Metarhizium album ARSEF 1941]|uniref:Serine/threonine-protein kinase ppk6 n=3 Tax=Metarhizium album (strain ARSEF 1941) TaxID=1081103 RepID=A0A0B2WJQ3_METAS|nr:serine/threonine-protein kinase ppk6 [Metarhizium album ARSEF 1941]KHN96236.1 serine/threonine-protein kinase ppk6 [Metarhizium album ARSEF 1941]
MAGQGKFPVTPEPDDRPPVSRKSLLAGEIRDDQRGRTPELKPRGGIGVMDWCLQMSSSLPAAASLTLLNKHGIPHRRINMSADLFAEFCQSANSTQPPSQSNNLFGHSSQHHQHHHQPQHQIQNQAHIQDISHVSSSEDDALPAHQSLSQWSSFQSTTPISMRAWDQPANVSQSSIVVPQRADDDDGWGDFEVAHPTEASATPKVNTQPPVSSIHGWSSSSAFKSSPHGIHNSAAHAQANDSVSSSGLEDFGTFSSQADRHPQPSWPPTEPKTGAQMKATLTSPNVLFDADDFELQDGGEACDDFDELGEFEAVESTFNAALAPACTSQLAPSLDLLGLDDAPVSPSRKGATPKVIKEESHPAAAALSLGAMSSSNQLRPLQSPTYQNQPSTDEDNVKKSTQISTHEWLRDAGGDFETTKVMANDSSPPPTNVPPPSILLSAFPELFNTGNSLFKSIAGQSLSVKQQVLSTPKAIQFLQGYVLLASTAARVIAGRKHRWHRDKILAKSMSISAAGSTGMKLTGVDKQQSAREDREAADVVAAWREHVGRLRSATATANSAAKASIRVPELTENPKIHTAKMAPTAPKPCVICGLKREERVAKVDLDVEDSFGECVGETFVYLNLLYYVSTLMLHREYFPFLPTPESEPRGPVDQPMLGAPAPEGWWDDSSRLLFGAAEHIAAILHEASECGVHLMTPFAGFCAFSAGYLNLYVAKYPRMNLGRSPRASDCLKMCLDYLEKFRLVWKIADGWGGTRKIKTIHHASVLYERATEDRTRYQGRTRADFDTLHQSVHEFRVVDRSDAHTREIRGAERPSAQATWPVQGHEHEHEHEHELDTNTLLNQLFAEVSNNLDEQGAWSQWWPAIDQVDL